MEANITHGYTNTYEYMEGMSMGDMVCLCGKAWGDPINMYTQEKDPFFICMNKCMSDRALRPTGREVAEHNADMTYGIGKRVWGK